MTVSLPGCRLVVVLVLCGVASSGRWALADSKAWRAGFSRVAITPAEPMFASGYGGRTKPSDGKVHDLYVRAAALQDPTGHRVLIVALDLIGIPGPMAGRLTGDIAKRYQLKRADVMLCCSHTHCGPALDGKLSHMLALKEKDWAAIRRYQKQLDANIRKAVDSAIKRLKPARLFAGNGRTGFAVNRRKPIGKGPTDHAVPVLRVTGLDGKTLRGVIFGYACHNTTLSFYQWCGDYAGFAQLNLEGRHRGAVAMFFTGCGADQNPLPRRTVALCQKYGRMLSEAVEAVMKTRMTAIEQPVMTAFRTVDLSFDKIPAKAHWEQQLKTGTRYQKARARILLKEIAARGSIRKTYPYPVQVWNLGGKITWVALGGEIVVDYAIRLKKELKGTVWVAGYANDVMAYIPSERVLKEGGYEGGRSMLYYQLPTKWRAGLEDRIVDTVKSLAKATAVK